MHRFRLVWVQLRPGRPAVVDVIVGRETDCSMGAGLGTVRELE